MTLTKKERHQLISQLREFGLSEKEINKIINAF